MANPGNVVGGFKSGINRKIRMAEEYTQAEHKYSEQEEAEIEKMISDIYTQMERWETKLQNDLMGLLRPEEVETYQGEFESHDDRAKKTVDDLRAYLENIKKVAADEVVVVQNANTNPPSGAHGTNANISKIDDTLRPEKLKRSATLEEFNDWAESFKAYFTHNKKALERCDNAIPRQLLHNCLDSRLTNALKTDDGVTANTPVIEDNGCLDMLKNIFLKECPLFVRRFNFLRSTQDPGESFSDWWVNKKAKAQECEFEKMTKDDMLLLGLMTGVHDQKLKEEFQRQRDPTVEGLVAIATNWEYAEKNMRNMSSREARIDRTKSNYKDEKQKHWRRGQSQSGKQNHDRSQSKGRQCKYCGFSSPRCKGDTKCPAKGQTCKGCQGKNHFISVCRKNKKNTEVGKGSQTQTRKVRVSRVKGAHTPAIDDNEPVPYAEMIFTPLDGKDEVAEPFEIFVYPDQGASQSIISYDLAKKFGMTIDRKDKKKIEDAQHGSMDCTGSTDFNAYYEGIETPVRALVTKSLTNECLLGWRALQRLKILHENFPHAIPSITTSVRTIATNDKDFTTSVRTIATNDKGKEELSTPNLASFDTSLATEDRIEKLIEERHDVFDTSGPLKVMKGGPMKIHLKKDSGIKPLHIFTPRKVPYAHQAAAKKKLDKDVALGVIERVEDGPSVWCSPASFVPKPKTVDEMRKILDVKHLNKAVDRPTHPFPSPKEIVSTIPSSTKLFAVFDCLHGYWQIELDEESKPLTTFLTEWGRYRYKRAPMGLVSSGDEFCARTDRALADLPGVKKLVDDILIFADGKEELIERIRNVFNRCQEWGITLSKAKYQFGNKVEFAGYVLTDEGYSPDPKKIAAIRDFSTPKNVTDVRSWFGLVEGFAEFVPDLKMAMLPLQGLMSQKNAFVWTPEHEESMKKTKEILTDPNGKVLRHFDPALPVALYTDASRKGIGFILTQKDEEGHIRLITCGSRFLNNAEKNYAVIELECLAIQWAVTKCRLYLAGTEFTVYTDHKPLLGIMNGKNLDAINNTRIQRLMSKLLGYCYTIEWIPGKKQTIADALSRSPVFDPEEEEAADVLLRHVTCAEANPDLAISELSKAASDDLAYQEIMEAIKEEKFLKDLNSDHPGHIYKSIWDSLGIDDRYGLLTFHDRIVVPRSERKNILEKLHIPHCGITKTFKNAKQLYYWPGMKSDITNIVASCEECVAHLPSQSLESKIVTLASRPFEAVSLDLGKQSGKEHLILADRYSGWPNVKPLKKLDTTAIIKILTDWFIDMGKPERIRTDGGPQFRSEFTAWCKKVGIIHELSSAYHHESNGHAENAVREMKKLLAKTSNFMEFRRALREFRNTPRFDNLSPAQWLFGRRQRTDVPALPQAYERLSNEEIRFFEAQRRKEVVDGAKGSSRSLPPLSIGQLVLIQDPKTNKWTSRGTITEIRAKGRSYYVNIDGKKKLRNRRFLRPCLNQQLPHLQKGSPISEGKPIQDTELSTTEAQPMRRSHRDRKKTVRFEAQF